MTKLTTCETNDEASESYSLRSSKPNFEVATEDELSDTPAGSPVGLPARLLRDAIHSHNKSEKVSFHTPGHKGRGLQRLGCEHSDVTELPGLDDLSNPSGVLAGINHKASLLWNTQSSLMTVNGASAGLIAAILSVGSRGRKLLVPRNAHKSVISGLVLSGLEPVWYAPKWNENWGIFEGVEAEAVETVLARQLELHAEVAAVLVVSPTYAGALTDLASIKKVCQNAGVVLIVDEAHGAQLFGTCEQFGKQKADSVPRKSAVTSGADVVVHSLHKTLGALTQTGMIHNSKDSAVKHEDLAFHLNLVQSTSPSYPLLLSIEHALSQLEDASASNILLRVSQLAAQLRAGMTELKEFELYDTAYGIDSWHLLFRHKTKSTVMLFEWLRSSGINPECIMGEGVLLMLGVGSTSADIEFLLKALRLFQPLETGETLEPSVAEHLTQSEMDTRSTGNSKNIAPSRVEHTTTVGQLKCVAPPTWIEQLLSPREAALAPSHMVPTHQAEGLIVSECIAPCPPGIPVCVPGQKLTKEVLKLIDKKHVRVVSTNQDSPRSVHKSSKVTSR